MKKTWVALYKYCLRMYENTSEQVSERSERRCDAFASSIDFVIVLTHLAVSWQDARGWCRLIAKNALHPWLSSRFSRLRRSRRQSSTWGKHRLLQGDQRTMHSTQTFAQHKKKWTEDRSIEWEAMTRTLSGRTWAWPGIQFLRTSQRRRWHVASATLP